MRRKICTIGNSYGISIPKEVIEKLRLTLGTQVEITVDEKAKKIILEPSVHQFFQDVVDKEFVAQVNDFIERYKPALKALAKNELSNAGASPLYSLPHNRGNRW